MTVHQPHPFNSGRGWISEIDSTPATGLHAEWKIWLLFMKTVC